MIRPHTLFKIYRIFLIFNEDNLWTGGHWLLCGSQNWNTFVLYGLVLDDSTDLKHYSLCVLFLWLMQFFHDGSSISSLALFFNDQVSLPIFDRLLLNWHGKSLAILIENVFDGKQSRIGTDIGTDEIIYIWVSTESFMMYTD